MSLTRIKPRIGRTAGLACLLALSAAAPALADQVTISGPSDTTACRIKTWGYDDCNGVLLDVGTGEDSENRSLLRFDIDGKVPLDEDINYAKVRLHYQDDPDGNAEDTVARLEVTPWTTSATWYTPDGTNSWDGGWSSWPYWQEPLDSWDSHWVVVDVFDALYHWQYEANNGLVLMNGSPGLTFDGPNSDDPPELVVNYGPHSR